MQENQSKISYYINLEAVINKETKILGHNQ